MLWFPLSREHWEKCDQGHWVHLSWEDRVGCSDRKGTQAWRIIVQMGRSGEEVPGEKGQGDRGGSRRQGWMCLKTQCPWGETSWGLSRHLWAPLPKISSPVCSPSLSLSGLLLNKSVLAIYGVNVHKVPISGWAGDSGNSSWSANFIFQITWAYSSLLVNRQKLRWPRAVCGLTLRSSSFWDSRLYLLWRLTCPHFS